jgi:hypothetical protein
MLTELKNDDILKRKINKQKYNDFNKDFDKIKKYLSFNPHFMDLNACYKLSVNINNIINVIENEK